MSAETQKAIDKKAKAYAEARDILEQSQTDLRKILRDTTGEHLPSVRKQAEKVVKLQTELMELVKASPELFPDGAKTQIIYEIKVGFTKAQDAVLYDDEATLIQNIKDNLPKAKADLLIDRKETVSKVVLKKLTAEELEKIGLEVTPGVDEVVCKPASAEIDKLVKLLVPEAAS
jgi:hypothetical protein